MNSFKLMIIGILFFTTSAIKSQVSVNVNIGSSPEWGPEGYTEARYYYLPDIEAYYDIQSSNFIYFGNGVWIHNAYLPARYRDYDLYSGYKVVMTDYRGDAPYSFFKEHKLKYKKGYRGAEQKTIGHRSEKSNSNNKFEKNSNQHHDNNQKQEEQRGNGKSHENKGDKQNHGGGKGKNK